MWIPVFVLTKKTRKPCRILTLRILKSQSETIIQIKFHYQDILLV